MRTCTFSVCARARVERPKGIVGDTSKRVCDSDVNNNSVTPAGISSSNDIATVVVSIALLSRSVRTYRVATTLCDVRDASTLVHVKRAARSSARPLRCRWDTTKRLRVGNRAAMPFTGGATRSNSRVMLPYTFIFFFYSFHSFPMYDDAYAFASARRV